MQWRKKSTSSSTNKFIWREYAKTLFPNVRLIRANEDKRDACVVTSMELEGERTTDEFKEEGNEQLQMHNAEQTPGDWGISEHFYTLSLKIYL